ncbi:MAG: restriction endonuclease subunit S, partial [Patescibacteria group bacterium]
APFEIIDGDRGTNYPKQDEFNQNGYCLFLNAKNVTTDGFAFNECYFISQEKDKILRKGKLQRNDIILTTRGTVGNIGFFNERIPYDNIRINSGMVIIRSDPKGILPEYTHQLFKYLKGDFDVFATGSAQPQLPIRDLKEISFSLPPLPEQRAIAGVLSSLDDKIDLLHRQNKTLEGMAEALWRKMFVEEAKAEWPMKEIGEIADKIQYGLTQSATTETIGPKFLRITDIQGGIVNWENVPYCYTTEQEFLKYKLNTGDIVVARTGASTGENLFIINPPSAVFASYLIRIQFDNIALSRYVSIHMRSSEYFNYIDGILSGSAQPNANAKQLTSFKIQLPSFEILDKFYLLVESLDEKYHLNNNQINQLSRLRDTLLPKLISGEVKARQ